MKLVKPDRNEFRQFEKKMLINLSISTKMLFAAV